MSNFIFTDGYLTLESLETPGNYVGIDSDGNVTSPAETDPASETAHFTPHVKVCPLITSDY